MVHDGEGQIRSANFAPFGAQARKGLRGSAFVDQMTVDVNERRLARLFVNDVVVPDLFVKGFDGHGFTV